MRTKWEKLGMEFCIDGKKEEFANIDKKTLKFLSDCGIVPLSFSHFGVVVRDIDTSLSKLNDLYGEKIEESHKIWVDSYKIFVARFDLGGKELELIEPSGDSFFLTFLKDNGEGLQHISFQVEDAYVCFEKLKGNQVEFIDHLVRVGSHGKIFFVKPAILDPFYLELCQY